MSEYRDIGSLQIYGRDNPYPHEDQLVNTERKTQVYQATHRGDGIRLPYMFRSFISFTYGGKHIEDFNLIATISGDRLNRSGYAAFDDTVSTYDNLDGQHYWTTHYKTNQMDFTLSTDGIDQRQLDDFLHWFKAGVSRELILAEHPNRGIMARISQPPTLNLLPFEQEVSFKISSEVRKTKTTLYKGDINLSLVMDQPHWYAIVNILGKKIAGQGSAPDSFVDYWDDPFTGEENIQIIASQDALKILYEDGIPLGSMIDESMLLGNGAYANVSNELRACTWDPDTEDPSEQIAHSTNNVTVTVVDEQTGVASEVEITDPVSGGGATVDYNTPTGTMGIIAGALVNADGQGITTLSANSFGYFFYAGTAPAPTAITFTLTPILDDSTGYITTPENTIHGTKSYNTFTIESTHKQELRFTIPNLYTSYNKALDVFNTYCTDAYTWEQLRREMRDQVRHPAIREWAIKCIDFAVGETNLEAIADNTKLSSLKSHLQKVLLNISGDIYPATFTFNSETGSAVGQLQYRKITSSVPGNEAAWSTYGTPAQSVEEDVGDMLKSNYIAIQDRNYPTTDGKIVAWQDTVEGHQYSHRIYHDVDGGLRNIQILYKNMYL